MWICYGVFNVTLLYFNDILFIVVNQASSTNMGTKLNLTQCNMLTCLDLGMLVSFESLRRRHRRRKSKRLLSPRRRSEVYLDCVLLCRRSDWRKKENSFATCHHQRTTRQQLFKEEVKKKKMLRISALFFFGLLAAPAMQQSCQDAPGQFMLQCRLCMSEHHVSMKSN